MRMENVDKYSYLFTLFLLFVVFLLITDQPTSKETIKYYIKSSSRVMR